MSLKVVMQGIESSFHHQAVEKIFPNEEITLLMCDSFEKVTNAVSKAIADYGVIAIENTIVGSILPNYGLIDTGNFEILAETILDIQMYVMALESESIHDIKEIHSHPVALLQCRDYLQKFPPQFKVIEGKDTASEAKKIKDQNLRGVAAIAGKQVAERFGLKILDSNIQDIKENHTRFVLLGKKEKQTIQQTDKASLKFVLEHNVGSLGNVLNLLTTFNINLTKIQSFPIVGKPWQYAFFVDVVFEDENFFFEVMEMLKKTVKELNILGVYKQDVSHAEVEFSNAILNGK
ncbi:prephenate dehydratase [Aequorivita antarctica]|uniref:prephenate dehydratase n=1 Tax=Aequorivita antarctica TaxID=153266 RepID=A0A5C6YYZ0_9FLAO|nr:prephenate dehydratase domain-containing protein [Aequorivita antarctica]TXD72933.1 prephenate dehydratase [Aequorivita antarctica]